MSFAMNIVNRLYWVKKVLIILYNLRAKLIFNKFGKNSKIYWPGEIQNGQFMSIGNNCYIKKYAWIQAIKIDKDPEFILGDYSYINRLCQIVLIDSIVIGKYVTISDNVFITDCTHGYKDVNLSVMEHSLVSLMPVSIGDGGWIGRNATIMGCKIGKHCVIGNSAFVTKDIPDYCVVVGNPAKIIKRYNFETQQWEKTDIEGNFLN
ncbi:MAG: acyltransferase [Paludibacter sp.]|nr:acyltransferase [Paludibacter sp.]